MGNMATGRGGNACLLLVLAFLSGVGAAGAEDCLRCHASLGVASRKALAEGLASTDDLGDYAIGLQDRGQLANYSSNFGNMSDFHVWATTSLHWPADANEETQYSFGLGLVVAAPGNVVESCLNSITGLRDWSPLEGSLGTLFSGQLRASDDTPFMAHSHLPESWPASGWPGRWRDEYVTPVPNPAFPTRQVPGQFTSDADIFAAFDDRENPRGPLGLEVRQSQFSYGRPYAEDVLVWRSSIHNRSGRTLDSLYVGYYAAFRPDYDFVDRIGATSTAELGLPFGRSNDIFYVWDVNGENDGAWEGNSRAPGIPALLVTETPRNMGVTDFHHFQADRKPDLDMDQWAVLSSQPDLLEDPTSYFHSPGGRQRLDSVDEGTLQQAYGEGSRINFFVMSGPFSLAAGDSVASACAALVGEGREGPGTPLLEDLGENIGQLWDMYWRTRYAGPGAPPQPELHGVATPGGARLWWEAQPSENAEDFEGYRLYRSTDQGQSWGQPITDSRGRQVGWVPLATFDRVDEVRGPDPNGFTHLGNDSGLAHAYTDSGLTDGLETWYCLTAFSTGQEDSEADLHVASLENPMGRSTLDHHLVAVVPGAPAADHAWPEALRLLQPEAGSCDATVALEILDPWQLPLSSWEMLIREALPGDSVLSFHLMNLQSGDTLLSRRRLPQAGDPPLPLGPGFRLQVEDAQAGVASLGWNEGSPCTFDWWTEHRTGLVNEYPEYVRGADDWMLEILPSQQARELPLFLYFYAGFDTTARALPSMAPIRALRRPEAGGEWEAATLWAEDLRLAFPSLELLSPLGWDLEPGGLASSRNRTAYESYTDALVLRADGSLPGSSEMLLKTHNFDWALDAQGDTLRGAAPEAGDRFTILTRKPLRPGLRYRFDTAPPERLAQAPALRVRVVPDPYVVGHDAEAGREGHQLFFTHLPERATVRIYTVAGDWVRTLEHDDPTRDTLTWDLRNADRQHVAYGLYIFHVSDRQGREQTGRFMVIR